MFKTRSLSYAWLIGMLAALWAGCTTSPVHNQTVASRSTSITFQAFTAVKSSTIQIQCRPYFAGGAWVNVATTTAGSTPHFEFDQGPLYRASRSIVVPNSCWYHWHSQYTTELRFMGGPYVSGGNPTPLAVYDNAGVGCLGSEIGEGTSYVDMMATCRLKTTSGNDAQSIYVHASNP